MSVPEDETAKYASLLATGERVLLVRQRHWLTFLEAGRWFVLALVIGLVSGALDAGVPNSGVASPLSTLLHYAFWIALIVGVIGLVWYFLVWRVERYLVTTRRVIEAGGLINKYTHDTSLQALTDMVGSGTRNARAISSVVRPPSVRSVSATCASSASAGWQQVNRSSRRSSGIAGK